MKIILILDYIKKTDFPPNACIALLMDKICYNCFYIRKRF